MTIINTPITYHSALRDIVATRTSEHGTAYVYLFRRETSTAPASYRVVFQHVLGSNWDKPDSWHTTLEAAKVAATNAVS